MTPGSIFVTTNGDIYVDNSALTYRRIEKQPSNSNTNVFVMHLESYCSGLFVDINNDIYCSMSVLHHIVKGCSRDNWTITKNIAGANIAGSASNMLASPMGIFVDVNFDLYVADYDNDRIQLFRSGELNGTTVAGNGSATPTITLKKPSGIVLDADGYLFIVDQYNHRIVGSGPNGFRCLVGCSGSPGSESNQLNYPNAVSFDSLGNMFVIHFNNLGIQKFFLLANSCSKYDDILLHNTK